MIDLVEQEDVASGRGSYGRKGKGRYIKYRDALNPKLEWVKDEIKKSPDGFIRMKTKNLGEELGMSSKHETTIYWGVKYTLWKEGVVVNTGITKGGEKLLILRMKTEDDKLSPSLLKAMEKENEQFGVES